MIKSIKVACMFLQFLIFTHPKLVIIQNQYLDKPSTILAKNGVQSCVTVTWRQDDCFQSSVAAV